MIKIKKIFIICFLVLFSILFISCDLNTDLNGNNNNTENNENNENNGNTNNETPKEGRIFIYSVNDFHGIVYESGNSVGLSKLFGYLHTKKVENPDNTIILSAGDMFQGSALSSMSRGEIVLKAMNYSNFDAMTIGNHEFDWGLPEVTKYFDDSDTKTKASFPLLGANVVKKSNGEIAPGLKPYTVFKRAGLNIGVIGIIGMGEENDILTSYVKDYYFSDELTAIKKYAKILREDEKCDIVIVSSHSDTSSINYTIANLTGSEKVDAVFNGHTHQAYYSEESRKDKSAPMPVVQSGCYGRYVGVVILTYDYVNHKVKDASAINSKATNVCTKKDSNIDILFDEYKEYVDIANEELGKSGMDLYQQIGGLFCANTMVDKFSVDLGICNRGGIRGSGFPIDRGDMISYGDIFEIMPFENKVVIVELTGSVIINRLFSGANDYYFISTNVDVANKTINGVKIESHALYKVATIDFLYEKAGQPFASGSNYVNTNILFRDVIAEGFKKNIQENGSFYFSGQ